MSEHKVSFQSDVESVHISEEFALVGMNNGSVACISLKEKETKWVNKFSHNIPISSTLIQTDKEEKPIFFAGNKEGQLAVFDENGKCLVLKQCKRSSIFGILGLGHPYIVAYYPGGNEEYAILFEKEAKCTLQKVFECTNSGNYYIKEDLQENNDLKWQIIKGKKEGSYAIERYNCSTSASTNRIIGLQLTKHKDVMFAYAFPSGNQKCMNKISEDENKMKKFPIFDVSGNISHYIRFDANVKNVINNIWLTKEGKMEKECLYFLLENGDVHRFSWDKLAKPEEGMVLTDETRQVIASNGESKQITLFGVHDNKICLIFNRRVLEIMSTNKQAQNEKLNFDPSISSEILPNDQEINEEQMKSNLKESSNYNKKIPIKVTRKKQHERTEKLALEQNTSNEISSPDQELIEGSQLEPENGSSNSHKKCLSKIPRRKQQLRTEKLASESNDSTEIPPVCQEQEGDLMLGPNN